VADSVEAFGAGDLVLLGSQLPHFWKSDESFHSGRSQTNVNAIVVQFHRDFFKEAINSYPEFFCIQELLKRASQGIVFQDPDRARSGKCSNGFYI
jgi:hypothetical protein